MVPLVRLIPLRLSHRGLPAGLLVLARRLVPLVRLVLGNRLRPVDLRGLADPAIRLIPWSR